MSALNNLQPAMGSRTQRTRIGRGQGSGRGGTSTKGHKGGQSRAGYKEKQGFEGGQMPLQRRIPKFGFKNPFRVEYNVVNLDKLTELVLVHADLAKQEINPELLRELGAVASLRKPIKVLGRGELGVALTIKAHKFSETAKAAIEKAGGKVIVVE